MKATLKHENTIQVAGEESEGYDVFSEQREGPRPSTTVRVDYDVKEMSEFEQLLAIRRRVEQVWSIASRYSKTP